MKKILALIVGVVLLFGLATPASATVYKWNRTQIFYGSAKVKFCDGTVLKMHKPERATRDVCKVWIPYGKNLFVFVKETGTELFDVSYCGTHSGRWAGFNSHTDTSHTAMVTISGTTCA